MNSNGMYFGLKAVAKAIFKTDLLHQKTIKTVNLNKDNIPRHCISFW